MGSQHLLRMLTEITEGNGTPGHIDALEKLGKTIKSGSLCGLGQTAPNPVLTTLRYFRNEYLAHIADSRCPAGVCQELITYSINENCTGCRVCLRACPADAITGEKQELHVIDLNKCTKCGSCRDVCKFDAVDVS